MRIHPDAAPLTDISLKSAIRQLVVKGVQAAVVAPERELKRWFSWAWYWDDAIVDDERLLRIDGFVAIR